MNMSWEILEAIKEHYPNDKESIASCLFYLYHNPDDAILKGQITDIMNDLGYCIQCGGKLTYYEYDEVRPIGVETMSVYDCLRCNSELKNMIDKIGRKGE